MTSEAPLQPYLLIAYYEWMLDNDWTPLLLVDATAADVDVPQQFVQDGQIVLNVSPSAVTNFALDHQSLSFSARFSGASINLYVPTHAVRAVYARDNDRGVLFSPEMYGELSVDEGYLESDEALLGDADISEARASDNFESDGSDPNGGEPKPPKGPPTLSIVK